MKKYLLALLLINSLYLSSETPIWAKKWPDSYIEIVNKVEYEIKTRNGYAYSIDIEKGVLSIDYGEWLEFKITTDLKAIYKKCMSINHTKWDKQVVVYIDSLISAANEEIRIINNKDRYENFKDISEVVLISKNTNISSKTIKMNFSDDLIEVVVLNLPVYRYLL